MLQTGESKKAKVQASKTVDIPAAKNSRFTHEDSWKMCEPIEIFSRNQTKRPKTSTLTNLFPMKRDLSKTSQVPSSDKGIHMQAGTRNVAWHL